MWASAYLTFVDKSIFFKIWFRTSMWDHLECKMFKWLVNRYTCDDKVFMNCVLMALKLFLLAQFSLVKAS